MSFLYISTENQGCRDGNLFKVLGLSWRLMAKAGVVNDIRTDGK